ncbi:MAG: BrnT family toxin [Candidatus Levyibacteriota bacterium]|nr:MAG: BrnT family toxin [Candidatus Levybacteria bacterium]
MPKIKRRFEWDFGNTTHLWERHQVRPFEAEEAIKDPHAIGGTDELHSQNEIRFAIIGKTRKGRTLFLAFTVRNNHIRVLHARDAKRKEVKLYEEKISTA